VNLIFCKTLHFIEGKKNRHIPSLPAATTPPFLFWAAAAAASRKEGRKLLLEKQNES
jgi:hypothetical protein